MRKPAPTAAVASPTSAHAPAGHRLARLLVVIAVASSSVSAFSVAAWASPILYQKPLPSLSFNIASNNMNFADGRSYATMTLNDLNVSGIIVNPPSFGKTIDMLNASSAKWSINFTFNNPITWTGGGDFTFNASDPITVSNGIIRWGTMMMDTSDLSLAGFDVYITKDLPSSATIHVSRTFLAGPQTISFDPTLSLAAARELGTYRNSVWFVNGTWWVFENTNPVNYTSTVNGTVMNPSTGVDSSLSGSDAYADSYWNGTHFIVAGNTGGGVPQMTWTVAHIASGGQTLTKDYTSTSSANCVAAGSIGDGSVTQSKAGQIVGSSRPSVGGAPATCVWSDSGANLKGETHNSSLPSGTFSGAWNYNATHALVIMSVGGNSNPPSSALSYKFYDGTNNAFTALQNIAGTSGVVAFGTKPAIDTVDGAFTVLYINLSDSNRIYSMTLFNNGTNMTAKATEETNLNGNGDYTAEYYRNFTVGFDNVSNTNYMAYANVTGIYLKNQTNTSWAWGNFYPVFLNNSQKDNLDMSFNVTRNTTHRFFAFTWEQPGSNVFFQTYYQPLPPGRLEVNLSSPDPAFDANVEQNYTFVVNATVICRQTAAGCGNVSGTLYYNLTSTVPDTPINVTRGDMPFFDNGTAPAATVSCPGNPLGTDQSCNVTWVVNATGGYGTDWVMGVVFNSSLEAVEPNSTRNASVSIDPCPLDYTMQWSSINFGALNPSSANNSAPGNAGDAYNITLGTGSCPSDFYISGTDLENATTNRNISVGNFSWSNLSGDVSAGYFRMTKSNAPLFVGARQRTNVTSWYWLDVPSIFADVYNATIYITGVISGSPPP